MGIVVSEFGKTKSGEETHLYTITNGSCYRLWCNISIGESS